MVGLQDCLTMPPSQLLDAIKVNTCGPLYLYQAIHALLTSSTKGERARPAVFLITSSGAGCISASPGIPVGAYGTSKAAVNMLAREMHLQNEETGLVVFPYHPGQSGRSSDLFLFIRTSAHNDLARMTRTRSVVLYLNFTLDLDLDSGWLQTDMGKRAAEAAHLSEAPHTLKEGVDAMIDLLDKANREEHGGKFLAYGIPGGALPW
jgi:NAD(P)-dependent dehydrogenase (short-subunit alcohol dehydrogenase family)